MKVTPHQHKNQGPHKWWSVEQRFSTRPRLRCQNFSIDNPLLEPEEVSGSFVNFSKEAIQDKDGNAITNSSHELFRGPSVEFDHNRPTVQISKNYQNLGLPNLAEAINNVNSVAMWGVGTRRVKLSNITWERKIYGLCFYYFTISYEFDIDYDTFDRNILDEGTKALNGRFNPATGDWELVNIGGSPPDPDDPRHYTRVKDLKGENIRVLLDGMGQPLDVTGTSATAVYRRVQFYPEYNFFNLGIPVSLDP